MHVVFGNETRAERKIEQLDMRQTPASRAAQQRQSKGRTTTTLPRGLVMWRTFARHEEIGAVCVLL